MLRCGTIPVQVRKFPEPDPRTGSGEVFALGGSGAATRREERPLLPHTTHSMPMDTSPAIIEPRRGKREEAAPSSCVIVFAPRDVDLFARRIDCSAKRSLSIFLAEVKSGSYEGIPITLAGPALGAPQAVMVLEKLIALGVRDVICVGWCGSLQPHIRAGDIVLPTGALSEEGTSAHYPISPAEPGPSMDLFNALKSALADAALTVHEAKVWTTDAPYRETAAKVTDFQKRGIAAVEMEASALLTVARFRGIRLALILTVSDELFSLAWRHGFRDPAFIRTREKLPEIVLRAFASLDTNRKSDGLGRD